jgi:glycosyltransferase involved in cell wall biosynthesis
MRICLLEPFHTGSHAVWAEDFARYSQHDVKLMTLSGRRWKWRMHGGAVTLARQFMESNAQAELLLVSDMLDLTTFLALTRTKTAGLPTAVYFHENQLTYPWSPNGVNPAQQRAHYAFINYTSALAADRVLFNSQYHLEAFTGQLTDFLKSFPDQNELESVDLIKAKSKVLHLGLDLRRFDEHRQEASGDTGKPPLILWNHRWEYDKNPEEFFTALYRLQEEGCAFEVAVLGESYRNCPPVFAEAQQRLGERIIHFGYAESFAEYAHWLWRADILPVNSNHDFFGASVIQAIYCNCIPLLPRRLAYPEHIPPGLQGNVLYDDFEDLLQRLRKILKEPVRKKHLLRSHVARYDWQEQITDYDNLFADMTTKTQC